MKNLFFSIILLMVTSGSYGQKVVFANDKPEVVAIFGTVATDTAVAVCVTSRGFESGYIITKNVLCEYDASGKNQLELFTVSTQVVNSKWAKIEGLLAYRVAHRPISGRLKSQILYEDDALQIGPRDSRFRPLPNIQFN